MNKAILHISAVFLFLAMIVVSSSANAVIYGPDLQQTTLRNNITTQYYVLSSAAPDPMNVFDWHDADTWNGGFTSTINSAQPDAINQTFLSPAYAIGFKFPLMGTTFDTIQVSLHGWVSFQTNLPTHSPTAASPQPGLMEMHPQRYVLAPYWSTFNQTLQYGAVYLKYAQIDGLNAFVVQWHDVQIDTGNLDTSAFFQLILFADGRFKFQYYSMGTRANGANATVGIKIDSSYIEYSRNKASISDGFALEFTPSLTPPPFISKTHAIQDPRQVYPSSDVDVPVFQFFIEPRLNQGAIDSLDIQADGSQGTNIPTQQMWVYIVRDANGNGIIEAGDPVVSGLNADNSPFLWDPWQGGDTVPVQLYDSPITSDLDNYVTHLEGRKYYLLVARFANLIMGDKYAFNITNMTSSELGTSPEFPIYLQGGNISVELANFPMMFKAQFNPPLQYFDAEPDTHSLAVLSIPIEPAQYFSSRLRSLMVMRTGSAPGTGIYLRFYLDRGVRGIYEPGIDLDITAAALDSSTIAPLGYTLGTGDVSGVYDIPLLAPGTGFPDSDSPLWLAAGGQGINILAVCDLDLGAADDMKTFKLKIVGMTYIGDKTGLVNLTKWGIEGSTVTLLVARSVIRFANAPTWEPDPHQYFAPGTKNVRMAYIAAYPSSRSGKLESITIRFSGTGYDQSELSDVRVYSDGNANGFYDGDDWLVWSGHVPSDNAFVTVDLPQQIGAFSPWLGGTTADFAALVRFIVFVDAASNAGIGRNFRLSCTACSIELNGESISLQGTWIGPTFEVVEATNPYFSTMQTELDGITVHTLTGSQVRAGLYRFYSGASNVKIHAVSFELPGAVWNVISSLKVYADENSDGFPQAQELLFSFASPSSPPVAWGSFYVPLGGVPVAAGSTVDIAIQATFSAKPEEVQSFSFALDKVIVSRTEDYGDVWLSPISATLTGIIIKPVSSVDEGGSVGISRGTAISVGTPSFVSSGEIPINLSYLLCGPVESIRLDKLEFSWIGDIAPNSEYVDALRIVLDDGDGRYEPSVDTLLEGTFTYNNPIRRFSFKPSLLYLYPSVAEYILVSAWLKPGVPNGSYIRIDLEPSSCIAKGISFDGLGNPIVRSTGTAPAIYGSKVQGATLYFGVPTTGGDDDDGDEGGNPNGGGSSGGGGGGCFLATAAFGKMLAIEVTAMCAIRDAHLTDSKTGCSLTVLYYMLSPHIAGNTDSAVRSALRTAIQAIIIAP